MLKKPGRSKLPDLSTTASLNHMTVLGRQAPNNTIIVILDKDIIKTTKTNKTITNFRTMSGGKPSPIVLNVGNAFVLSKKYEINEVKMKTLAKYTVLSLYELSGGLTDVKLVEDIKTSPSVYRRLAEANVE